MPNWYSLFPGVTLSCINKLSKQPIAFVTSTASCMLRDRSLQLRDWNLLLRDKYLLARLVSLIAGELSIIADKKTHLFLKRSYWFVYMKKRYQMILGKTYSTANLYQDTTYFNWFVPQHVLKDESVDVRAVGRRQILPHNSFKYCVYYSRRIIHLRIWIRPLLKKNSPRFAFLHRRFFVFLSRDTHWARHATLIHGEEDGVTSPKRLCNDL